MALIAAESARFLAYKYGSGVIRGKVADDIGAEYRDAGEASRDKTPPPGV